MNKTICTIILGIIAAALLIGCTKYDAQPALSRAAAATTPSQALVIIRAAIVDYCNGVRYNGCDAPSELEEAMRKYFSEAARAGDGEVLRELFAANGFGSLELKDEVRPKLLQLAKESSDPDLLAAAAASVGNDRDGVINLAMQIEFLQRAWAVGDDRSAGKLAHVYVRMNDYQNAYLWSLRCIRRCNRSDGWESGGNLDAIELRTLEEKLSKQQIAVIQGKAAVR